MLSLKVSVGVANVLLWLFMEVFLIFIPANATYQIGRFFVNRRLLHNKKVLVKSEKDWIDNLPYNSDLHLSPRNLKLMLTLYRLIPIAASIYIGSTLDGENKVSDKFRAESALSLASPQGSVLTLNNGDDLNTMGKLSCLRIVNNNFVILYKAFVASGQPIICEDGVKTVSKNILLEANITTSFRTPKQGLNLQDLPISNSTFSIDNASPDALNLSSNAIRVNATDENGELNDIATRIVLVEKMKDNKCLFGIWRSEGAGFERRVDIKLEAPCSLQIAGLERLLLDKPQFLPPRMSFLYQIVDAVVVEQRVNEGPEIREENEITAVLPIIAIILGVVLACISVILTILFDILMRFRKKLPDLSTIWGILSVLCKSEEFNEERGVEFEYVGGNVVCNTSRYLE